MGKTDIRDAQVIADQYPAVGYQAFDLIEAGPHRMKAMLYELTELFDARALDPLPVTTWMCAARWRRYRFISQARHTGKVVLTMPSALADDLPEAPC